MRYRFATGRISWSMKKSSRKRSSVMREVSSRRRRSACDPDHSRLRRARKQTASAMSRGPTSRPAGVRCSYHFGISSLLGKCSRAPVSTRPADTALTRIRLRAARPPGSGRAPRGGLRRSDERVVLERAGAEARDGDDPSFPPAWTAPAADEGDERGRSRSSSSPSASPRARGGGTPLAAFETRTSSAPACSTSARLLRVAEVPAQEHGLRTDLQAPPRSPPPRGRCAGS